jgi:hypothetical protein
MTLLYEREPNEDEVLAVKRGAYWLDEVKPGWVSAIDLVEFDISSGYSCVLGQLFGDYDQGLGFASEHGEYNTEDLWESRHGFNCDYSNISYSGLNVAWKRYIEERS